MSTISSLKAFADRHLSLPRALLLAALLAAALLGTALVSQYVFGLHPCHLCLYQRVPYAAIIVIGLGAFFLRRPQLQWALAWLCVALFAVDAGIASYHAGVEAGIFPGPSGCTSTSKVGQTLEELRAEIMNAPLVSCDQAMAHFLGLSMAAWNALAASALTIAGLLYLLHLKRKTS